MRWFVSRNGETVGPVDEGQVVAWVRGGMIDAMVRDEAGGPWTPLAQSPFAPTAARAEERPSRIPQAFAVCLAAGAAGYVWGGPSTAVWCAAGGFILGLIVGNPRL